MKTIRVFILSSSLGMISAVVMPILIIAFSHIPYCKPVGATLFRCYLLAANLTEPFVWGVLPWELLIPGGGASGAFAVTLVSILTSWGVLFSGLWFLFLNRYLLHYSRPNIKSH